MLSIKPMTVFLIARRVFLLFALCHFMTRFARERNSGESVSPICFAAFRLITNSNFVACCTGRSAGFGAFQDLVHVVRGACR